MAERSRVVVGLLIALTLLAPLGGTALYVAVFSMADCPQNIHEERKAHPEWAWSGWGKYFCHRCKDSGRITFLNLWRDGRDAGERWEGMEISTISCVGFQKTDRQRALDVSGLRSGNRMTRRLRNDAFDALWGMELYYNVDIRVGLEPNKPGKVAVDLMVVER